ncbi:MAG: RNA polymerase sigma factor RpoE [Gammaproteobacteria bacterium]
MADISNMKQEQPREDSAQSALADWVLVRRVQQGDSKAFNLLVSKYQRRIEFVIYPFVENRSDILDIVQETFLRAFRAIDDFRGDSAFFSWLFRIAQNTAKNHLIARTRRPPDSDIDASVAEFVSTSPFQELSTPEHLLLRDEIEQQIFRTIESLPEELREVIVLREIEGLSYDDIALKVKCPIGTVRSRLFRAREIVDASIRPLLMG